MVPAHGRTIADRTMISLVIPIFNEEDSLVPLCDQIDSVLQQAGNAYEIIFVDDGSTDNTPDRLSVLAESRPHIRCVTFRRNFGKAAALDAGFGAASGDCIVTMDGDLQDDPCEIPNFLAKLDEGYDVVSGWKRIRHDPLGKTLPSRVFNFMVGRLSGIRLNDFNCGYKAYRAEALEGLPLYGELHRFLPVLLHWRGYRVGEIPVNHRPRRFGSSKYGFTRLLKGGLDFLGVMLNTRFATRPLHVFGAAGVALGFAGFSILTYLSVLWFAGLGPIGDRPLLMLGMLLVMTSAQVFTVGLLSEFIQRQAAGREKPYSIKSTSNLATEHENVTSASRQLARMARRMREDTSNEYHHDSARYGQPAHRKIP